MDGGSVASFSRKIAIVLHGGFGQRFRAIGVEIWMPKFLIPGELRGRTCLGGPVVSDARTLRGREGAKLERLMPPGAPQEAGFKMGRRVRHLDNDVSQNTGYERPNGSQRFRQPQHATRGACSRRPSCQGCGQHQFRSIRSSAAREFWLRCLFHSCRVF